MPSLYSRYYLGVIDQYILKGGKKLDQCEALKECFWPFGFPFKPKGRQQDSVAATWLKKVLQLQLQRLQKPEEAQKECKPAQKQCRNMRQQSQKKKASSNFAHQGFIAFAFIFVNCILVAFLQSRIYNADLMTSWARIPTSL